MTKSNDEAELADDVARAGQFQRLVRGLRETPVTSLPSDDPLLPRLNALDPELAMSFTQALKDLNDPARLTFLGPAGEIREVMRAAIHKLAPDSDVEKQSWFKGDDKKRPTQTERIRFIVQGGDDWQSTKEAAVTIEEQVGKLGRALYGRASKAFHAGTERREVEKILGYVRAVLDEILP